jgi:hypothetical protein
MSLEKLKPIEPIASIELPRKRVPLLASAIKILQKEGLNPLQLYLLYRCDGANERRAESYLLSLACRQAGDQTGILGPLIGVSNNPEDTRQILMQIETNLLDSIDEIVKQKVFQALETGIMPDAETMLTIDQLLGQAVLQIRQVAVEREVANPNLNKMTWEAHNFWLRNRLILEQLLKQRKTDIFGILRRSNVATLDDLLNITQSPIVPKIDASPLIQILPDEVNRLKNPQPPAINEPLGFISRLNMAGSDLFRFFASNLREALICKKIVQKIESLP